MAKIHSHYDNLKVARQAPPEVIRAAYKALSQKYHPDKNPGDEKAARIMAIVNSAYGTLSDPLRRREHDEWIAAEEWEIEWLESTRAEEGRERHGAQRKLDAPGHPPRQSLLKSMSFWFALSLCLAVGCVGGILLMSQTKAVPAALADAIGARPEIRTVAAQVRAAAPAPKREEPPADPWAVSQATAPDVAPPRVKAMAVTQLVIPARAPDCETELHSLVAPNGEPWPSASGYLGGFPIGNQGEDMRIAIDNTANTSPVLVKVYDLDRLSNVRHVYVLASDSITVDRLAAGKYEVRYQDIHVGGSADDCSLRRKEGLKQAAIAP